MRKLLLLLVLVSEVSFASQDLCFHRVCTKSSDASLLCSWVDEALSDGPIGLTTIFQINNTNIPWNIHGSYGDRFSHTVGCVDPMVVLKPGQNRFKYDSTWVNNGLQNAGWTSLDIYLSEDFMRTHNICQLTVTASNYSGNGVGCDQSVYYSLEEISPELAEQLEVAKQTLENLSKQSLELEAEFSAKYEVVKSVFDSIEYLDFDSLTEEYFVQLDFALELFKDLTADLAEIEQMSEVLKQEHQNDLEAQVNYVNAGLEDIGYSDRNFIKDHDLNISAVEIPQIQNDSTFSLDDNYYKLYADNALDVIKNAYLNGDNEGFLIAVDAWLTTMEMMRGQLSRQYFQSPAEWTALNEAYAVVNNFVFKAGILDSDFWFSDSPVTEEQKEAVSVIKEAFPVQGKIIETELRKYRGDQLPQDKHGVVKTIEAIGNGIKSYEGGDVSRFQSLVSEAVIALKENACVIGSVVLGDFSDMYELVVGRGICSGAVLSTSERLLSGVGLVVGTGRFWRGVGETVGLVSSSKKAIRLTEAVTEQARILGITDNERIRKFGERLAKQFPCEV